MSDIPQSPANCRRKRRYCRLPVHPSRQKGSSSAGEIITSMRRTFFPDVMNIPKNRSNLQITARSSPNKPRIIATGQTCSYRSNPWIITFSFLKNLTESCFPRRQTLSKTLADSCVNTLPYSMKPNVHSRCTFQTQVGSPMPNSSHSPSSTRRNILGSHTESQDKPYTSFLPCLNPSFFSLNKDCRMAQCALRDSGPSWCWDINYRFTWVRSGGSRLHFDRTEY